MDKKFLDYEGFKVYHDKLVSELRNLKYNPQMMFETSADLFDKSNWVTNPSEANSVYGLKSGLIITVGKQIWQLIDPSKFQSVLTRVDGKTPAQKASSSSNIEDLGWRILNTVTDINIEDHTLKITK